jgi:hypothetical protein
MGHRKFLVLSEAPDTKPCTQWDAGQAPAFVPQGGTSRRQAKLQIGSNEQNWNSKRDRFGHWGLKLGIY